MTVRRSPRRQPKAEEAKHQEEQEEEEVEQEESTRQDHDDNDDVDEEEQQDEEEPSARNENARDSSTSKRNTSRELRKRRRDELKTKSMGVGLSISKNATSSNKIVFDDNQVFDEEANAEEETTKSATQEEESDDDSDDDDDAIEEVKSSVARDKAMNQLARERETAVEQKLQTKTKKRKSKPTKNERDDDEFDEDFFAQVDSEMAEQRKQRKLDKQAVPTGRHTTFLSTEEEADSLPIQAEHNIELVVLGNDTAGPTSATSALLDSTNDKVGIEPSEASHIFARGRLTSGKANKKGTKKKKQADPGWRRSKKMNVLAFGRSKVKRSNGRAAPNFVVS